MTDTVKKKWVIIRRVLIILTLIFTIADVSLYFYTATKDRSAENMENLLTSIRLEALENGDPLTEEELNAILESDNYEQIEEILNNIDDEWMEGVDANNER